MKHKNRAENRPIPESNVFTLRKTFRRVMGFSASTKSFFKRWMEPFFHGSGCYGNKSKTSFNGPIHKGFGRFINAVAGPKNKPEVVSHVFILFFSLLSITLLFSCISRKREHHKRSFLRIDTAVEVTIVQSGKKGLKTIWAKIDSLLADWEKRYSQTDSGSEVARLNQQAGKKAKVGPVLLHMLSTALRYSDSLTGDFDPTILPIKELWSMGERAARFRLPARAEVESELKQVNYKSIILDSLNGTVQYLSPKIQVDVGGIAKGYVLTEIGRILDSYHISDYLVVAGGDIICKGLRKDGTAWRIGIQHPRKEELLGDFRMVFGSVATSGDYERFHMHEGTRYHHLFSTKTGYPCSKNRSFTLWGPEPVEVDILATGLFCREAEDILSYIDARPRLAGMVVDSTGYIHISQSWKGAVNIYSNRGALRR